MAIFLKGNDVSTFANDVKNTSEPNSKFPGYQQGVWVPVVIGGNTAGSYSYPNRTAMWSRIGNTVNISCRLFKFQTVTAGTGSLNMIGYPYAPDNSQAGMIYVGAARVSNLVLRSTTQSISGQISAATQRIGFSEMQDDGDSTSIPITAVYTGTDEELMTSLYLNVTYITDDTTWTPQNGATLG